MHALNTDIICANSSQAKGRVERSHKTLQDRLVKELRRASTRASAIAHRDKFTRKPVDMWTIGVADRLCFPRFPRQLGKRGNASLRPHTHRHSRQSRI
jgi:hypothetical protein